MLNNKIQISINRHIIILIDLLTVNVLFSYYRKLIMVIGQLGFIFEFLITIISGSMSGIYPQKIVEFAVNLFNSK